MTPRRAAPGGNKSDRTAKIMSQNNGAAGLAGRAGAKALKVLALDGAAFGAGLLASLAGMTGGLYPFGLAAAAAAPDGRAVFTLLGVCIGYMLPGGSADPLKYIAGAVIIFLIKWLIRGVNRVSLSPAVPVCAAAAGCGAASAAAAVLTRSGAAGAAAVFSETAVCACAAYFFSLALRSLPGGSEARGQGVTVTVSRAAVCCVGLLALSRLSVAGVSPGRAAAVLAVLAAARYSREAGGCAAGAAAGLMLSLGDSGMSFILGGYAFGGLMAGIFAPAGRFPCAAAFVLAESVCCIVSGNTRGGITCMYEAAAASAFFMLLPDKALCALASALVPAPRPAADLSPDLRARLRQASSALGEVASTVSEVSGRLGRLGRRDISEIYSQTADSVCRRCGMRLYCWGAAYNDTMSAMNDMTDTLKRRGCLSRQDVPEHFSSRCGRLGEFLTEVNRCYGSFVARDSALRQTELMRGLLTEEFGGLSLYLGRLAQQPPGEIEHGSTCGAVRSVLASSALGVTGSVLMRDGRGRVLIDARAAAECAAASDAPLLRELSQAAGCELEGPFGGEPGELLYREKPSLSCRTGSFSISRDGERFCGDACSCFTCDGRAVMIISDGMGCGGPAAVDGNLAVRLFSSLLRADFGLEASLRVVNSAMMLRAGDESFATVDVSVVDLFTGRAEFFKAGAPPTYLIRSGRAERIARQSLPVGIIGGVKAGRAAARLRAGDLIVMASDGATDSGDEWLTQAMLGYGGGDPQDFARSLAVAAKKRAADGRGDDITVLAAAVE
jgi:stage II sporulation protein E